MQINQYTREVIKARPVANQVDLSAIGRAGDGFRQAADVADVAGAYVERERQAINATKLNKSMLDYQKDLMLESEKLQQENMATPEGFATMFETRSKEIAKQYEESFSDRDVKRAFADNVGNVQLKYFNQNLNWQRDRNITLAAERLEDAAQTINTMAFRGGDINELFKEAEASAVAGSTFLAPEVVENQLETMKAGIVNSRLQGMIQNGRVGEAKALLDSGKYDEFLGGDGLAKGYGAIQTRQKQIEAEFKKQQAEQQAIIESRFDLALASARTPQELSEINSQIDTLETQYGEEWANDYRTKVVKQNEEYVEKQESVALGAVFATGQSILNPENSDHTKAFNNYYESLTQNEVFANATPQEKNGIVVDVINQSKYVPDNLRGEIIAAARSNDEAVITQAADLIDRVSIQAPELLPQLGSQEKINRINMINDRINAGVAPARAIEIVDNQLDPRNAASEQVIKTELQAIEKETDFRNRALKSFRTYGDWFGGFVGGGIDNASLPAKMALDSAALEYRVHFEDTYRKTRDVAQAEKVADQKMGLWGRTTVNPSPMPMKFPPEHFYSIPNVDSSWIREQAIDDVLKLTKGGFVPYSRDDLEDQLYIVPHPDRTPRTAEQGRPEYSVMILKDGTPINILGEGKYWRPDIDAKKQQLIKGKD